MELSGLEIEPIVGVETHVQLATRTKLYCGCPVYFGAPPNSHVCPVCLGLPGALPVINRQAVDHAVTAGLALNCRIAELAAWDRKNYYYPDLPKNYQISQFDEPIASAGHFEFSLDGRTQRVGIRRAHLEEDAGSTIHDLAGASGVDLNRAAIPLLEIVSEPDLHSAQQAHAYAVQLRRLVRYLGISEANMQRGQMRFEPNINVRIVANGREVFTPIVEVKNLNSFRALRDAIAYEIARQVEQWQRTGETAGPGNKTNRGWDETGGVTVPQREKEELHDYRYFPEPDLLPLHIDSARVESLRRRLPELPQRRAERFIREYELSPSDAPALVDDRASADLLDEAAAAGGHRPTLARHFLSFWAKHAHERGTTIAGLGITAPRLAEMANLVATGQISSSAAARVSEAMLEGQDTPSELAARMGLFLDQNEARIAAWVSEVLARNEQAVRDATTNPRKLEAARSFLIGRVMQASGGRADPQIVSSLIESALSRIADGE